MAKKKVASKPGSRAVKSPIPQQMVKIPSETKDDVLLYETNDADVTSIIGAVEFKEGLVKLKLKFNQEIQEWSSRFGVSAETRILFTLHNNLKG